MDQLSISRKILYHISLQKFFFLVSFMAVILQQDDSHAMVAQLSHYVKNFVC